MNLLPTDVKDFIITFLDCKSILNLSYVNKVFRRLTKKRRIILYNLFYKFFNTTFFVKLKDDININALSNILFLDRRYYIHQDNDDIDIMVNNDIINLGKIQKINSTTYVVISGETSMEETSYKRALSLLLVINQSKHQKTLLYLGKLSIRFHRLPTKKEISALIRLNKNMSYRFWLENGDPIKLTKIIFENRIKKNEAMLYYLYCIYNVL